MIIWVTNLWLKQNALAQQPCSVMFELLFQTIRKRDTAICDYATFNNVNHRQKQQRLVWCRLSQFLNCMKRRKAVNVVVEVVHRSNVLQETFNKGFLKYWEYYSSDSLYVISGSQKTLLTTRSLINFISVKFRLIFCIMSR